MSKKTYKTRGLGRRASLVLALAALTTASCTSHSEDSLPARALPSDPVRGLSAPISLTASDGTGLRLISLKARAVVEEPLAFTELHLVFENPTDRTIEGRFEISMPPDAAISRFAMKIDGQWQEGEVVERRAAQVAFEDALHRKQDPALLENKAGNAFSARVFPISARERKELIVSYSQELTSASEPYRLMLRGLPELAELDASVALRDTAPVPGGVSTSLATSAAQTRLIELKRSNWAPDQDLEVRSERGTDAAIGLRHENLAVARVAPVGAMPAASVGGLTVLFDTSASRALDFDRQLVDLGALLVSLREQTGEDFALRVLCFDQGTLEVYAGPASGFGAAEVGRISARRALGASDLRGALAAAAVGDVHPRLLILSDGVATAGPVELVALQAAARTLADAGVQRIDAIVDGGIQDASTLKAITTAALPHKGVVADGRLPVATLGHKLASETLPDMRVSVPGSAWVWPELIEGAQPGDPLLVYADLPAEVAMKVVLTGDATIETEVASTTVERPLLERAWVGARIERLGRDRSKLPATDNDGREALKQQIIALSTRFRVLSDFTALLVLESEGDYQRFGIDRTALTDILTVGVGGVTLQARKSVPSLPAVAALHQARWGSANDATRHHGEEGQMGKPTAISGRSPPELSAPQQARVYDPELAARDAGLLGEVAPDAGHFLASPYGGAFAVGDGDSDVWGGLTGTEVGSALGVGGLDLVGTGRGGGATGEGTIGVDTGLIGKGSGFGRRYSRSAGAGFGGRDVIVPTVRQAKAEVQGALDKDIIRRIVRAHINQVRDCYNQALARDPKAKGRVAVQFIIGASGKVVSSVAVESSLKDRTVGACIAVATRRWAFPRLKGGGSVTVRYPFILEPGVGRRVPMRPPTARQRAAMAKQQRIDDIAIAEHDAERARLAERQRELDAEMQARNAAAEKIRDAERAAEEAELRRSEGSPYHGKLFDVMTLLHAGSVDAALTLALAWREASPGDVLALVALGEALEAAGDTLAAARAYGSIIDLFPTRVDLRRYVGGRLERLGALELAIDNYAQVVAQRPDHPAGHRMYAFALAKAGRPAEAFAAIAAGLEQRYPSERFLGVDRILREDAGLLLAAWLAAEPSHAAEILLAGQRSAVVPATAASLRFVLTWETDANDVDFHVLDNTGERAWFSHKTLASGGELFADVTNGYGPECFAIADKAAAFPYTFAAQYYSRGPMGYGMGKLQIVQHDGHGGLKFDDRPFLIMKDRAFTDLGKLERPL